MHTNTLSTGCILDVTNIFPRLERRKFHKTVTTLRTNLFVILETEIVPANISVLYFCFGPPLPPPAPPPPSSFAAERNEVFLNELLEKQSRLFGDSPRTEAEWMVLKTAGGKGGNRERARE